MNLVDRAVVPTWSVADHFASHGVVRRQLAVVPYGVRTEPPAGAGDTLESDMRDWRAAGGAVLCYVAARDSVHDDRLLQQALPFVDPRLQLLCVLFGGSADRLGGGADARRAGAGGERRPPGASVPARRRFPGAAVGRRRAAAGRARGVLRSGPGARQPRAGTDRVRRGRADRLAVRSDRPEGAGRYAGDRRDTPRRTPCGRCASGPACSISRSSRSTGWSAATCASTPGWPDRCGCREPDTPRPACRPADRRPALPR